MTQPEQPAVPETFVFFVRTNKNFHQGGFVFFSREEFNNAKDALAKEVTHLLRSEQDKEPNVEFKSWGVVSSATGEIIEQFTDDPSE